MFVSFKKAIYRIYQSLKSWITKDALLYWYFIKKQYVNPVRLIGKPKIFCIGMNKTGTTSLYVAMQELGYLVGDQYEAEHFLLDWEKRDFTRLFRYCRKAQFFQDVPFSLPDTYRYLDQQFPGSKFILTIRDSPEIWYNSVVRYHTKLWSTNELPPRREHLKKVERRYRGWAWDLVRLTYNTDENDLYNKDVLIKRYTNHKTEVIEYFKNRPQQLLVINVGMSDTYQRLCDFLNIPAPNKPFPWRNKT